MYFCRESFLVISLRIFENVCEDSSRTFSSYCGGPGIKAFPGGRNILPYLRESNKDK